MKWLKRLCRAIAFLVVAAPGSSPRTVQPVTYSYQTTNDGGYTSTYQDGIRRVPDRQRTDTSSGATVGEAPFRSSTVSSLSNHPSVLAHHYYDPPPPPETSPFFSQFHEIATTQPPTRATASYFARRPTTVAVVASEVDEGTTETPIRKVRVWKRRRPLKGRNEIPVEETSTTAAESPADDGQLTEVVVHANRFDDHHHRQEDGGAANEGTLDGNDSEREQKTHSDDGNLGWDHAGGPKVEHQDAGSPTNTTESVGHGFPKRRPKASRKRNRTKNAGASRSRTPDSTDAPVNSVDHSEGSLRDEADDDDRGHTEVRGRPKQRQQTANQRRNNAKRRPYEGYRSEGDRGGDRRRPNGRRRTPQHDEVSTPPAGHEESYDQRPLKRGRVRVAHPSSRGNVAGSTNRRYEKETVKYTEESSTLKTDLPYTSTDESDSGVDVVDMERESKYQPGTHRELFKYTDSEKMDAVREHVEDDEDDDPTENEPKDDSGADREQEADAEQKSENVQHPLKTLRKPLRYAYTPDQKQSSSNGPQEQQEQQEQDERKKKGGGEKHRSAHHESDGHKDDEGYDGEHEYDKAKQGHSDKEGHSDHHHQAEGKKKKHKEEDRHYSEHLVDAKGEKGTEFGESGNHKKGHSTKGSHNIHKKNEFLKKHEFYDEHHEDDEHKKYGDFHKGHKHEKGDHHKKVNKDGNYSAGHKGTKGKKHKGHDEHEKKGHNKESGHKRHHKHEQDYSDKDEHMDGKKWGIDD